MAGIIEGIVTGGVGGAVAGLAIALSKYIQEKIVSRRERDRIYSWLKSNTSDKAGEQFRSTRAIASWNNLTEDRVRYLCSIDDRIFLSTGEKVDLWGIYGREARSVYSERGLLTL